MKALVFKEYGPPEKVLSIQEVNKPIPNKDEVLVRVLATAINDYDWSMVTGKPLVYRLLFGLFAPKAQTPGMELAGRVEAVGVGVTDLKVGDAVYGDISAHGFGTFAEYISINKNAVRKKPDAISFEHAAAIPHACLLALQGLSDIGKIKTGQKVLINGAGGGVGVVSVQLAKLYSCEVTGVDAAEKFDMMKQMGYDHVIDYKKEDFTKNGQTYDLILDCKSDKSALSYVRALTPTGRYVTIGGHPLSLIKILLLSTVLPMFSSKTLHILGLKPNEGLEHISDLFHQGKLSCNIDGTHSMDEIPSLIQYFGEGKHMGKVVVSMVNSGQQ